MVQLRIAGKEHQLTWEAWEARVRAGRVPPEAEVRFPPVTGDAWRSAGELDIYRSLLSEAELRFREALASGPAPLCTALLLGVQIRIWLLAQQGAQAAWLSENLTKWSAPVLEDFEVWRPLSMGIVHTSLAHVSANLVWFGYTAWNLERALGWRNLLALYFGSVFGGSLFSMWGAPWSPSLGASGGIFGLIAACVVFGLTRPELLPERARRFFGFALLPYMVVMLLLGFNSTSTDNWAHLGGMVSGAILAIFVDPPGLDRRPGWTRAWHGGLALFITVASLGIGALGPRITPLEDAELVRYTRDTLNARRRTAPPREPDLDRNLRHAAPWTWVPSSTLSGMMGAGSPLRPRVYAAEETRQTRPVELEDAAEAWLNRMRDRGHEIIDVVHAADEVAGFTGLRVQATVEAHGETLRATWRGAARGIHLVEEITEVDLDAADRLQPLFERLRATLRWGSPATLLDAQANARLGPRNDEARRRLATTLASWGDPSTALSVIAPLLDDPPTSKNLQVIAQLLSWYPEALPDAADRLEAFLARDLGPRTLTTLLPALRAVLGDVTTDGLLLHAWLRAPGDAYLRRHVSALPACLRLDDAADPVALVQHPLTGASMSADDLARLRLAPPSVEIGRTLGALRQRQLDDAREAALDAYDRQDAHALDDALRSLHLGCPPLDAEDGRYGLRSALIRATDADPPRWWTPPLPPPAMLHHALPSVTPGEASGGSEAPGAPGR